MKQSNYSQSLESLQGLFKSWLNENNSSFLANKTILCDNSSRNSNKILCDVLIRYEELAQKIYIFSDVLNVNHEQVLQRFQMFPARNPSRPKGLSLSQLYNPELCEVVQDLASWEFEQFRWDPDLVSDDI